jgi:hypothetical protein
MVSCRTPTASIFGCKIYRQVGRSNSPLRPIDKANSDPGEEEIDRGGDGVPVRIEIGDDAAEIAAVDDGQGWDEDGKLLSLDLHRRYEPADEARQSLPRSEWRYDAVPTRRGDIGLKNDDEGKARRAGGMGLAKTLIPAALTFARRSALMLRLTVCFLAADRRGELAWKISRAIHTGILHVDWECW